MRTNTVLLCSLSDKPVAESLTVDLMVEIPLQDAGAAVRRGKRLEHGLFAAAVNGVHDRLLEEVESAPWKHPESVLLLVRGPHAVRAGVYGFAGARSFGCVAEPRRSIDLVEEMSILPGVSKPVEVPVGGSVTVSAEPLRGRFRGEKIVLEGSHGSLVTAVRVANQEVMTPRFEPWWQSFKALLRAVRRRRRPVGLAIEFFASTALGNAIALPSCVAGEAIEVDLYFPTGGVLRSFAVVGRFFEEEERSPVPVAD